MWLSVALQLLNSTHSRLSQHSRWLSLQARSQSYEEDPSPNPGRHTVKTNRGEQIFLGYPWWRAGFLRTSLQRESVGKAEPWKASTFPANLEWKGSEWRFMLIENWQQRIQEGWRKHYVLLQEWNQINSQRRVEQEIDLALKNLKLKILDQTHDETTDRRYRQYKANEYRIFFEDGLLHRKPCGKTGNVKYYQILIPKHLVNEVLQKRLREFGRHPGITKTKIT